MPTVDHLKIDDDCPHCKHPLKVHEDVGCTYAWRYPPNGGAALLPDGCYCTLMLAPNA